MTVSDQVAEEFEAQGLVRDSYDLKPLSGVRRMIARRLTEAARDVPHYALTAHADMADLLAARRRLNQAAEDGAKVSLNDLIVAACGRALAATPRANASYSDHGILHHRAADVAFAVAIEDGLVTPIVRDAANLSVAAIAAATKDLTSRGKRKRLRPEEYTGGTFCVSNLGMFGVSSFTSIINPPQGAILSVGAVEDRVVPRDGAPAIRPMLTLTLTCDHRVIDGAIGAQFLQAIKAAIEAPDWATA